MTEKPKRKNSSSRFVVGLLVVLVLCICTIFVLVLLGPVMPYLLAHELYDSCEVYITDNVGIRIQSFTYGMGSGIQYYESTRDNGSTWRRFHTSMADSGVPTTDCSSIGSVNDHFIYLVPYSDRDDSLLVTHDGGETWHEWTPSNIEEYPVGFRCNTIEEVAFQDTTYGGMQVGCSRYDGDTYLRRQNINLFTDDGGITWALTYE
jgi:hypothetical protein